MAVIVWIIPCKAIELPFENVLRDLMKSVKSLALKTISKKNISMYVAYFNYDFKSIPMFMPVPAGPAAILLRVTT